MAITLLVLEPHSGPNSICGKENGGHDILVSVNQATDDVHDGGVRCQVPE